MSWTQGFKTFLCTQNAYFSQILFTNLSKNWICFGPPPNTVKLHILEWPFIVASLRHTCAIIMRSNQHLDMPHLWGGWIISAKEKYNTTIQIKLGWALFVTYTIIQSIMRSEMCSLHLTHPSVHTWSSGQPTVQRPGSSRGLPAGVGIWTHNLGLPRVSSRTLYPLGQRLP